MSTGNVSNDSPPKDIQWHPIDLPIPLEVNMLGKGAVERQRNILVLKFDAVEKAWKINLASSYGKLYALLIKATPASGIPCEYEAIVCADLPDNAEHLTSFREFSYAQ